MRGSGQVLADYRGKIISDAGGKTFTTKQTTVGGNNAVEFTTAQIGSTIGGYSFSQMHGYMIDITDTTSLEINHFSPSGIATEWTSDETIFNTIVQSLVFATGAKGSVVYPMTTAVPVASATPAVIAPIQ